MFSGTFFAVRKDDNVSQPNAIDHEVLSSVLALKSSDQTWCQSESSQSDAVGGGDGDGVGVGNVHPSGCPPLLLFGQPFLLEAPDAVGSQPLLLTLHPSWHIPQGTQSQHSQSVSIPPACVVLPKPPNANMTAATALSAIRTDGRLF
jgi:hypothetical protein